MLHAFSLLEGHPQVLVLENVLARVRVDDVLNDVVLVAALLVVWDHQLGI